MTKDENAMLGKASVLLVLGLALGGCGDTHGMKSQGQTHWLKQCDSDADCGELSCECGVCAAACDSAGECSVDGVETQCFQRGSGAVRALCGSAHDVPLCLEECDDDCASGQSCQANACLPSSSAAPDGSVGPIDPGPDGSIEGPDGSVVLPGPDASTGLPGPDASTGLPGPDGGSIPEPPNGSFTLGLRNESLKPIALFVSDCNGDQRWFDVRAGDSQLVVTSAVACDCAGLGPDESCPSSLPVCAEPRLEVLESSDEKIFTWDTGYWFPITDTRCSYRWPVAEGAELLFRACWLPATTDPATLESLRYPEDFVCDYTRFTLDSRSGTQWLTARYMTTATP